MGVFGDIESATSDGLSFLLSPIRNLVRRGLHVVAGWALSIFHLVGNAWDRMVDGSWALEQGAAHFALSLYHLGGRIVGVYLPELASWAGRNLLRIENLARGFATTLFDTISRAELLASQLVDHALLWVVAHVLVPLDTRLTSLEHTIGSDLRTGLDLLLHPGKLIETVGSWVLDHVVDTLDALGGPVFRWFRRSAVHDTVTVAHELEQLIAGVL